MFNELEAVQERVLLSKNGTAFKENAFEVDPHITRVTGAIKAAIYERGGVAPTNIIHSDQDWYIDVEWSISGPMINLLSGFWEVQVGLESVGLGKEYTLPLRDLEPVPMNPCKDGGKYRTRIEFPAGKIKAGPGKATVYELAVTVVACDPCGNPALFHAYASEAKVMIVRK